MKARIVIGLPINGWTKESDIDPTKPIKPQIAEIAKRIFFTESTIQENKTTMPLTSDPTKAIIVLDDCGPDQGFILVGGTFVIGTWDTLYGCGHKREILILDNNPLSIAAYLEWREATGPDGDNSQCFACFCEELNRKK